MGDWISGVQPRAYFAVNSKFDYFTKLHIKQYDSQHSWAKYIPIVFLLNLFFSLGKKKKPHKILHDFGVEFTDLFFFFFFLDNPKTIKI